MTEKFEMRLKDDREELLEEVENKVLPRIDRTTRTASVEVCLKLGLAYMDKLEEKEEQIKKEKKEWSVDEIEPKI